MKNKYKLLSVLLCVVLLFTLTGCGNTNNEGKTSTTNNEEENETITDAKQVDFDLSKIKNIEKVDNENITTSDKILTKGIEVYYTTLKEKEKIIVFVKNNNDVAISTRVYIEFFNKDNESIGSCSPIDFDWVNSGTIDIGYNWNAYHLNFDKFDHIIVKASCSHYDNCINVYDSLELIDFKMDYENRKINYEISTKENYEEQINTHLAILYYKNNEIVDGKVEKVTFYKESSTTEESYISKTKFDSYSAFITDGYLYM